MEKCKATFQAFVPGLPRSDLVQLSIFLTLFTMISCALLGNWLGISFLINNGAILLICFFTIALPPNTRIYYLFSTSLPVSAFIDLMSISFNWNLYADTYDGFLFFYSFFVTLILVVIKVLIALHQFEIAKTLNSEPSPVSCIGIYTGFINAITLQQTPIAPEHPGTDMEAPGQEVEAPVPSYQNEEPQQSTTIEIVPAEEDQAPQKSAKSEQRPIQAPAENFKTFKPINENIKV